MRHYLDHVVHHFEVFGRMELTFGADFLPNLGLAHVLMAAHAGNGSQNRIELFLVKRTAHGPMRTFRDKHFNNTPVIAQREMDHIYVFCETGIASFFLSQRAAEGKVLVQY